jgi:hypothetical protein
VKWTLGDLNIDEEFEKQTEAPILIEGVSWNLLLRNNAFTPHLEFIAVPTH